MNFRFSFLLLSGFFFLLGALPALASQLSPDQVISSIASHVQKQSIQTLVARNVVIPSGPVTITIKMAPSNIGVYVNSISLGSAYYDDYNSLTVRSMTFRSNELVRTGVRIRLGQNWLTQQISLAERAKDEPLGIGLSAEDKKNLLHFVESCKAVKDPNASVEILNSSYGHPIYYACAHFDEVQPSKK